VADAQTQDGLTLQTRKNWPPEQWEAKSLVSRPPRYHDKAYDTMACIPTAIEQQIYALRVRCIRLVSNGTHTLPNTQMFSQPL